MGITSTSLSARASALAECGWVVNKPSSPNRSPGRMSSSTRKRPSMLLTSIEMRPDRRTYAASAASCWKNRISPLSICCSRHVSRKAARPVFADAGEQRHTADCLAHTGRRSPDGPAQAATSVIGPAARAKTAARTPPAVWFEDTGCSLPSLVMKGPRLRYLNQIVLSVGPQRRKGGPSLGRMKRPPVALRSLESVCIKSLNSTCPLP